MNKHVLTVIFKHKHEQCLTSQVYTLDSLKQANFIIDKLTKDFSQYRITYSIAAISE